MVVSGTYLPCNEGIGILSYKFFKNSRSTINKNSFNIISSQQNQTDPNTRDTLSPFTHHCHDLNYATINTAIRTHQIPIIKRAITNTYPTPIHPHKPNTHKDPKFQSEREGCPRKWAMIEFFDVPFPGQKEQFPMSATKRPDHHRKRLSIYNCPTATC